MYYKVVYIGDGKLQSCCQNEYLLPHDMKVEYKIGEWAYPTFENSKLFAFSSLKEAKVFIKDTFYHPSKFRIFECEVQNPQECFFKNVPSPSLWKILKEGLNVDLLIRNNSKMPQYTILADAIKLIAEVL